MTGIIPAPTSFELRDGVAVPPHRGVPARRRRRGAAAVAETFAAAAARRHGIRAARRRGRARGIRHRARRRRGRGARRSRRGLHARVGRPRRRASARDTAAGCSGASQTLRQLCPPRSSERMPRRRPTADGPCPRHPSPTPRGSPTAARCSTSRGTSSPSTTCSAYIDAIALAQAQRAAPAPHRRPGLAHPDRLVARAHRASAPRPRWAATAAASTRRPTTGASSSTRPSGSSRSCPRSTCPGTRTRRSAPTPS